MQQVSWYKFHVCNYIRYEKDSPVTAPAMNVHIAASFQEAVIEVLVAKSLEAVSRTHSNTLAIGGGVASNSRLRERLKEICQEKGIRLVIPSTELCVDNACMIGAAGFFNQKRATQDWRITSQDSRFAHNRVFKRKNGD